MDALLSNITRHEVPILFIVILCEAVGLPVPAALALLIAGGMSAKSPVQLCLLMAASLSAFALGDTLMFLLGRRTGWWLLGVLCKVSINPETCILRSAESFVRRGRMMLVFAKFLPGINTLAPSLAGSMNMKFLRFLPPDLGGAAVYILAYGGAGAFFSRYLAKLTSGYEQMGHILAWGFGLAIVLYFGYHLILVLRAGTLTYVPRVSAAEIAKHFYSDRPKEMALYDVRSHGYYSKTAHRIKGSTRLEPNTLLQEVQNVPRDREIILYCTCRSEGTSLRVARILQQHGCRCSVIKGGLRAWKRGGYPLETVPAEDVVLLPTF